MDVLSKGDPHAAGDIVGYASEDLLDIRLELSKALHILRRAGLRRSLFRVFWL